VAPVSTAITATPKRRTIRRLASTGCGVVPSKQSSGGIKKLPRRTISSPSRVSSCCRWNSEACCDKDHKNCSMHSIAEVSKNGTYHDIKKSLTGATSPPRMPRRSFDEDESQVTCRLLLITPDKSMLPPVQPQRKRGESNTDRNCLPPRMPLRQPDDGSIVGHACSA